LAAAGEIDKTNYPIVDHLEEPAGLFGGEVLAAIPFRVGATSSSGRQESPRNS
jgi:hypothetical protein